MLLLGEIELHRAVIMGDRAPSCYYDERQSSTTLLRLEIELDRTTKTRDEA